MSLLDYDFILHENRMAGWLLKQPEISFTINIEPSYCITYSLKLCDHKNSIVKPCSYALLFWWVIVFVDIITNQPSCKMLL